MAPLADFSPRKVQLLVMQPTPFCNISCDYCYLAARDDRRLMPLDVVTATAENLLSSDLLGTDIGVVWHAGEPLVAPSAFYREAFASIERILGGTVRVRHSVQTNGTLVDEMWCELFRQWNVRVGVSIDGPACIHDTHRKTRNGKPTHERVMRGIELLQRHQVPFHVIAVVTEDSLAHGDEILDFFLDRGIHEIAFNVDEQEGVNPKSTIATHEAGYEGFLRRVCDRVRSDRRRVSVRELEFARRLVLRGLPRVPLDGMNVPENMQVLPFAIVSVDAKGGFSTFSPELLDQIHPQHGPLVFGDVRRDRIADIRHDARFQRVFAEIVAGVRGCSEACDYFSFCGGGAPANKLAELGTFASTETAYCRTTMQRPFRVVLEAFENAQRRATG